MEKKTITNETLERVKTLPRFDYVAFQLLVTQKQINCFVKFKRPRTIFFDELDGFFYYLNPFHCELHKCGKFNTESEVLNG
jgi:hypothetical protein